MEETFSCQKTRTISTVSVICHLWENFHSFPFFFSCWHLQLKKTTIMCLIHMKRHLEIWNTSRFSISPQGSNRSWTRALEDLAALYSSGACREEHLRMGDEVLPVLQKQQQSPRERHSLRKLQPWILGGFSSQEFNGMADWPVVGGM